MFIYVCCRTINNIFKNGNRSIAALLTLCILLGITGSCLSVTAMAAETTATVEDRKLSKYGFFVDYVINNSDAATLGQDVNLMLETDGWKINGLEHGSGYILWIKNGLIDSLEGYSYEEPWPEEITFCEKKQTLI